ncbi:monovalent cation/H+ antiporter subunit B [Halococcus hamelinensis 100A6]|uniref:Monovalent cation/H+ antiporter subunit B n=1 Tax=Halococcus hamelinensis 100A6 TaxID=1132509 RepID=M0M8B4_9EURY|nr:monovalent cation/H+ antiporter subunit B [Halococcus hamelinensis 100A6]
MTAIARTLLTAVIAFAAYSLGLAMVWVVFRAPDVAFTEAAVGVGVTTALFLLLVARTTRHRDTVSPHTQRIRPRSIATAVLVTLGVLATVPSLPAVGATATPAFGPVTQFYLEDTAARGINNAVTAVLVVYRGFDTFGEIGVVFAAAVAVLAVLGRETVV